ncbi:MAG: cob(I)yrinic acid a,c-diamide adenosyltransferase [Maricaulaceae bacterium]
MVKLNKIYTRTGDKGDTGLADGARVPKTDPRVMAYGEVDEANAAIGLARVGLAEADPTLDAILARVQNDLFDAGADLSTPEKDDLGWTPLRMTPAQVSRLEADIDAVNGPIPPLDSFVLPGGTELAARLHLARTACRRAERAAVAFQTAHGGHDQALIYLNRLSDLLFVAARRANANGADDVKWVPGANR